MCKFGYTHTVSNFTLKCFNNLNRKHWYRTFSDIQEHWKLFQCKTLILCILRYWRMLKTVQVQNIDTVHSQVFKNTENCSSAKLCYCVLMDVPEHWKLPQGKTLTLYICRHSRKLYKILMTYRYSRTLKTLYEYAAWIFMNAYKWYSYEHTYTH